MNKELENFTDEEIFAETRRRALACKIWTVQDVIDEMEMEELDYTDEDIVRVCNQGDFEPLEDVSYDWEILRSIIKDVI